MSLEFRHCPIRAQTGRLLRLVAVALWAVVGSSEAAFAQSPPAAAPVALADGARLRPAVIDHAITQWSKLDDDQRLALVDDALQSGDFDLADELLGKLGPRSLATELRGQYLTGVLRKAQGRYEEAIDVFRALLAGRPELTRVRLELAHTLYQAKQDESARHHFELVLGASAADPNLERTVRGFISSMDARRRWQFSTYMTVAPSTNLNQGSDKRTVTLNGLPFILSESSVKQRGVGVVSGFQGGYFHPLGQGLDLLTTVGLHVKRYKQSEFNDTLGTLSIGPRWRWDRGFVGFYGTAESRQVEDADQYKSWGGLLSTGYSLTSQDMMFGDVSCSKRSFDEDWRGSNLEYWSGHACSLAGRFERHLDSATYVRVLGSLGRENTARDHLDNRFYAGGFGAYRELTMGISLYLQALYTRRRFLGDYPVIGEPRVDDRIDLSTQLIKRDFQIFGLAPALQYTYTINKSNVEFLAFDAHGVSLTLTKKF